MLIVIGNNATSLLPYIAPNMSYVPLVVNDNDATFIYANKRVAAREPHRSRIGDDAVRADENKDDVHAAAGIDELLDLGDVDEVLHAVRSR